MHTRTQALTHARTRLPSSGPDTQEDLCERERGSAAVDKVLEPLARF